MQPNNNQPQNWQQPPAQDGDYGNLSYNQPAQTAAPAPTPAPAAPASAPVEPVAPVEPASPPVAEQVLQQAAPQEAAQQEAAQQFQAAQPEVQPVAQSVEPQNDQSAGPDPQSLVEPLHWMAPEYMSHNRGKTWYVVFGVVVFIALAVAIYMRIWTFVALIPIMAAALLFYVRRPPTAVQYSLSPKGLYVGDQLYAFKDYKAFGLLHQPGQHSFTLIPIKRFSPGVSVFFPEELGEQIVDMLAARLPMQEMNMDVIDKLLHKMRI